MSALKGLIPETKSLVKGLVASSVFLGSISGSSSLALDEETRLVTLDDGGRRVLLTSQELKRGKRLFNNACAICHVGGLTKTNPNIGLDMESLSFASPPLTNIRNLMVYFCEPVSFDGIRKPNEVHPSVGSSDIFPKMRTFTYSDLFSVAGYILVQAKVGNEKWGGGKIYY
jgi:photosystem II cytochrome c550